VLEFAPANAPTNAIAGFGPGDILKLDGETITGDSYAPGTGQGVLTLTFSDSSTLDLAFTGSYSKASFSLSGDEVSGVACYAAGTRIATPRGEMPIEALRVGDTVISVFGGIVPVRWLGHRRVDCRRHPRPAAVWPVRIAAGAFGPHRELWLSPDHAVFFDNVLIPIRLLINGTTIARMPVNEVTYYHLELPRHDVLLAEGLPAESYLDTANRSNFANASGPVTLHPDFSPLLWEAESCAPLIVTGPKLDAARRRVNAFAPTALAARSNFVLWEFDRSQLIVSRYQMQQ
jgi:hypothetical protein